MIVGTAAPITTSFEAWREHSGEGPKTVSTESRADGSYELSGFNQPNIIALTRYLAKGHPGNELGHGFFVDITVRADGSVQDNVQRVPLVTEDLLYLARRMFKAFSLVTQRTGGKEVREKQDLPYPFPSSYASKYGNTITGIDIVLKQSDAATQPTATD